MNLRDFVQPTVDADSESDSTDDTDETDAPSQLPNPSFGPRAVAQQAEALENSTRPASTDKGIDGQDGGLVTGYNYSAKDNPVTRTGGSVANVWKNNARDYWRESDHDSDEVQQDLEKGGVLSDVATVASVGNDYLLDNPAASVQDGSRTALAGTASVVRGEDVNEEQVSQLVATGAQEEKRIIAETYEGVTGDDASEGVSGAAGWLGGVVASDMLRNVTGIDASEGSDADGSSSAGPFAILDVVAPGASKGAQGTKIAAKGIRNMPIGSLIGRIGRSGGDDALQAGLRGLRGASDNIGNRAGRSRSLRDAFGGSLGVRSINDIPTGSLADDSGSIADNMQSRINGFNSLGDDVGSVSDDATQTGPRTGLNDDALDASTSAADDTADASTSTLDDINEGLSGLRDDISSLGDDAGSTSRWGGIGDNFASRRPVTSSLAVGGAGGYLLSGGSGGGIFTSSNDNANGTSDGDGTGDGDGSSDGDTTWGRPDDNTEELGNGWVLIIDEAENSDRTRYFVAGQDSSGQIKYLDSSGSITSTATPFTSKQDAKDAYNAWLDQNGGGRGSGNGDGGSSSGNGNGNGDGQNGWSNWEQVRSLDHGWFIYGRSRGENEVQYVITGKVKGDTYFIGKNGKPSTSRTTFTNTDKLVSAWQAYLKRRQNDPESTPVASGEAPSSDDINAASSGGIGGLGKKHVGGAVVAAGVAYAYTQGMI